MRMKGKFHLGTATLCAAALTIAAATNSAATEVTHVAAPAPVTALHASPTSKVVKLTWVNPKTGTYSAVMVRRLPGTTAPATFKLGLLVGAWPAGHNLIYDTKVVAHTTYSYSVFAYKGTAYSAPAKVTTTTALSAPLIFSTGSYALNYPTSITYDGANMWVPNVFGNAVSEFVAASGKFVRNVFNTSGHDVFNHPSDVAFANGSIWVTNPPGPGNPGQPSGTVTQINAKTGLVTKVLGASSAGGAPTFFDPEEIASTGADLWVVNGDYNGGAGSLTEFSATTGLLVRTVTGVSGDFNNPNAILAVGPDIWVTNNGNGTLTEVSVATGAVLKNITGFPNPTALAYSNGDIWVAINDSSTQSVSELSIATLSIIHTYSAGLNLLRPGAMVIVGTHAFVANTRGGIGTTISVVSTTNGSLVTTLSGAAYTFDGPCRLIFDGTNIWAVNETNSTLTEFPPV